MSETVSRERSGPVIFGHLCVFVSFEMAYLPVLVSLFLEMDKITSAMILLPTFIESEHPFHCQMTLTSLYKFTFRDLSLLLIYNYYFINL